MPETIIRGTDGLDRRMNSSSVLTPAAFEAILRIQLYGRKDIGFRSLTLFRGRGQDLESLAGDRIFQKSPFRFLKYIFYSDAGFVLNPEAGSRAAMNTFATGIFIETITDPDLAEFSHRATFVHPNMTFSVVRNHELQLRSLIQDVVDQVRLLVEINDKAALRYDRNVLSIDVRILFVPEGMVFGPKYQYAYQHLSGHVVVQRMLLFADDREDAHTMNDTLRAAKKWALPLCYGIRTIISDPTTEFGGRKNDALRFGVRVSDAIPVAKVDVYGTEFRKLNQILEEAESFCSDRKFSGSNFTEFSYPRDSVYLYETEEMRAAVPAKDMVVVHGDSGVHVVQKYPRGRDNCGRILYPEDYDPEKAEREESGSGSSSDGKRRLDGDAAHPGTRTKGSEMPDFAPRVKTVKLEPAKLVLESPEPSDCDGQLSVGTESHCSTISSAPALQMPESCGTGGFGTPAFGQSPAPAAAPAHSAGEGDSKKDSEFFKVPASATEIPVIRTPEDQKIMSEDFLRDLIPILNGVVERSFTIMDRFTAARVSREQISGMTLLVRAMAEELKAEIQILNDNLFAAIRLVEVGRSLPLANGVDAYCRFTLSKAGEVYEALMELVKESEDSRRNDRRQRGVIPDVGDIIPALGDVSRYRSPHAVSPDTASTDSPLDAALQIGRAHV